MIRWFKNLIAPKELIGVSFPDKFCFNLTGETKKTYYMVYFYLKGDKRSYRIDLAKDVYKQFTFLPELEYWVATGEFALDPQIWDKRIDWKVSPRDLKKRYLASLIRE